MLATGHFTVIKGNVAEIQTLYGTSVTQRGVDSTSQLTVPERAKLAAALARRHSTVVLLTGPTDIASDGARTFRVDNGHEILGGVTGTGCTLGTTVSAMVAAWRSDPLLAAVAGAAMFGIAAQNAVVRDDVRGPGTFVPAFLDELYNIKKGTAEGDLKWLELAKIEAVIVDQE